MKGKGGRGGLEAERLAEPRTRTLASCRREVRSEPPRTSMAGSSYFSSRKCTTSPLGMGTSRRACRPGGTGARQLGGRMAVASYSRNDTRETWSRMVAEVAGRFFRTSS